MGLAEDFAVAIKNRITIECEEIHARNIERQQRIADQIKTRFEAFRLQILSMMTDPLAEIQAKAVQGAILIEIMTPQNPEDMAVMMGLRKRLEEEGFCARITQHDTSASPQTLCVFVVVPPIPVAD